MMCSLWLQPCLIIGANTSSAEPERCFCDTAVHSPCASISICVSADSRTYRLSRGHLLSKQTAVGNHSMLVSLKHNKESSLSCWQAAGGGHGVNSGGSRMCNDLLGRVLASKCTSPLCYIYTTLTENSVPMH